MRGAGARAARPVAAKAPPAAGVPRVLFVNHSARMGGAEFVLHSALRAFDGGSTLWLFEDGPLRERLAGEAVRTVLAPGRSAFGAVKRDASLARALPLAAGLARTAAGIAAAARRHEVVYANSQKAFALAAPAGALARRPLVWHLHDILTPSHFGAGQLRLVRSLSRLAARVIAPSRQVADAFVALGGDASRTRVVWNGVAPPPEAVLREDKQRLRARLGLPPGFLCGVFSRLAPWKGQDVLLRALAHAPGAGCLVVGDALFGETEFAVRLRQQAQECGLAERVHFLGHRDDVAALMRAVDAVVHPSVEAEPFGRTLVEAMLCRTPVIATDAGAAPEILDHGACGLLVPPGDAAGLARALGDVRRRPDAARERAERAVLRAETLFSEARMQAELVEVVRGVAHGRRASS